MDKNLKNDIDYCLNCPSKPCTNGCPLGNDIPSFINYTKENDLSKAFSVLSETTVLASICGRVCPYHRQCEGNCVRRFKGNSVNIGKIEAYVGDALLGNKLFSQCVKNGFKVAIVGGGPSGLTCASFLIKMGYSIDLYEKHYHLGGIMSHGIPDFRLDPMITYKNLKMITDLGINVFYGKELGKNLSFDFLKENYDAVFLGFGANLSSKLNVPGADLCNVYGANEVLEENLDIDYKDKKVIVVGAGNVAMDMARTARRKGAFVKVIYHKKKENMSADFSEYENAVYDGIEFSFETDLLSINGSSKVTSVNLTREVFGVDYVFFAVGSKPDYNLTSSLNLSIDDYGYIKVNDKNMTSTIGVFAGGDLINFNRTIAYASKSGRDSAYFIDEYIKNIGKN